MSTSSNKGNQLLTYRFQSPANSDVFNRINLDLHKAGIYAWKNRDSGASLLTKVDNSTVEVAPFTAFIRANNEDLAIRVQTQATYSLSVNSGSPYVVLRFAWAKTVNNYVDILNIDYASIQSDDLILGRAVYEGSTLLTEFDYTQRNLSPLDQVIQQESHFLTTPENPPSNYVYVNAGKYIGQNALIEFSGSQSPEIPDTTAGENPDGSTNGRNDYLYVDEDETLQLEVGTPAASPSTPDYKGRLVVAEIRRAGNATEVTGEDITQVYNYRSTAGGGAGEGVLFLSQYDTLQEPIDELNIEFSGGTLYIDTDIDITDELATNGQPIQLYSNVNLVGTRGHQVTITSTNESHLHFKGTDAANLTLRNLKLVGPGIGAAGGGGVFLDRGSNSNLGHILFENITIDGVANSGISINTPILTALRNVKVLNCAGHSFNVYNGTSTNFYDCYAITSTQAGFYLSGMTYCVLNGCAAEVNGVGYDLDSSNNIVLNGCGVEDVLDRGVSYPGNSFRIQDGLNNVLSVCYSRNPAGDAVVIEGTGSDTALNNSLIGFRSASTGGTYALDNSTAGSTTLIECSWDKSTNLHADTVQIDGTRTIPTYLGTHSGSFPSGVKEGQEVYRSDQGKYYKNNGNNWIEI